MKRQLLHAAMLTITAFGCLQQASAQQWITAGNNLAGGEKLGSLNNQSLNFYTNNSQRMKLDSLGRLGLGITTPVNLFTLKGAGSSPSSKWISSGSPLIVGFGEATAGNADFNLCMGSSSAANARGVFGMKRARGTLAAPAAVLTNDYLGSLLVSGYDGTNFQGSAAVDFFADGTPTAGNVPARISFVTGTNSGNRTERLKISSGGDVYVMTGNLGIAAQKTIQFPTPTATSPAMITIYPSGTQNRSRMVIGHSAAYPNYGLQYNDSLDQWNFVGNGSKGFIIDPVNGNATNGNMFNTGSLSVKNDAAVGRRLGVNGAIDSLYAVNVNANSAIAGINVTDPVDGDVLYSEKSGINTGIFVAKTNNGTTTPSIYGYGDISAIGVKAYSQYNDAMEAFSDSLTGIYALTQNPNDYAGYFEGDVYTTSTYQTSDARLKKNIRPLDGAMSIINKLAPKAYEFRNDGLYGKLHLPRGNHFGLLAQDVEKIMPEAVKDASTNTRRLSHGGRKESTEPNQKIELKAVNYNELIPVLIKGMQEQQAEIESLKEQVKQLTANNGRVAPAGASTVALSSAIMEQNVPNPPVGNYTAITYNIPLKASQAYITVSDMHGRKLQQVNISQKGVGTLPLNTAGLAAGTYSYSLNVDGRIVETKQMVIADK